MGKKKQRQNVLEALGYVKTDALSNLEAKRGCAWANRLIVSTVEALEHFETVKDFYYKEEKVEFKDMFSAFLQRPDGYLELWQKACDASVSEKVPPSKAEAESVSFAGGLLWQALFCIVGLPDRREPRRGRKRPSEAPREELDEPPASFSPLLGKTNNPSTHRQ